MDEDALVEAQTNLTLAVVAPQNGATQPRTGKETTVVVHCVWFSLTGTACSCLTALGTEWDSIMLYFTL